jgi:hypothetical protein
MRITAVALTLLAAGCSGLAQGLPAASTQESPVVASATPVPVSAAASSPTAAETPQLASTALPVATATLAAAESAPTMAAHAPTEPAAVATNVEYLDDFTDPGSGWPDNVEFGNYYIGYHEPNHYHVEVHVPHDRALVAIPKHTFTDFTLETLVTTEPNNTAKTGDFRYGVVFRRSGNQFYAFVVSPHTKNWAVLKSSPNGVTVLQQGANAPTQGLTADDHLRIDVKGNTFFFRINDQALGSASDPEYTTGEAGFLVETIDSPRTHIHFGTTSVRDVEAPQLACTVLASALNLRRGPDNRNYTAITAVRRGAQLEPLGRDASGTWINVRVAGSDKVGWVFAFPAYISCNLAIDDLAVTTP